MIIRPMATSAFDILVLLIMGSKIEVNSVSEDKVTNVTDTVEILMEWKNSTQCTPTIPPTRKNWISFSLETCIELPIKIKKIKRESAAIKTRYQTKWTAEIDNKPPNTPVNPQLNTVKCRR